jgi:hypothetical protein
MINTSLFATSDNNGDSLITIWLLINTYIIQDWFM